MSVQYLTSTFDIHGGGMDLIFPHHENEPAQSCAACAEAHISYWVHNGFVTINEEKMSKSTGNFFTIRETLQDCRDALSPFQEGNLDVKAVSNAKKPSKPPKAPEKIETLKKDFESKMSDDLHTADVLKGTPFQEVLKLINTESNELKKKQKQQQLSSVQWLIKLELAVRNVLDVLGLLSALPYSEVLQKLKEKALVRAEMSQEEISHIVEERAVARKNKDFSRSDQIRAELTANGISLMDLPTGTTWRPCVPEGTDQVPVDK